MNPESLSGLIVLGFLLLGLLLVWGGRRARAKASKAVALELGLRYRSEWPPRFGGLRGRIGDVEVHAHHTGGSSFRPLVRVPITLRWRRRNAFFRSILWVVHIGDEAFEEVFETTGAEEEVLSLLDGPTRGLLLRLGLEWDVEIRRGVLRVAPLPTSQITKHDYDIRELIRSGVRVASHLAERQRIPLPERLAENSHREQAADERRRNLIRLLALGGPAVAEARARALQDPDASVRFVAATAHPPDLAVLESLVEDTRASDRVRSEARAELVRQRLAQGRTAGTLTFPPTGANEGALSEAPSAGALSEADFGDPRPYAKRP